jgi:hypothetical protein
VALAIGALLAITSPPLASAPTAAAPAAASTVWLCRPGMADDPCTASLKTTVVGANGSTSISWPKATTSNRFACFYVYGTVSQERSTNADLRRGRAEIASAEAQAAPFSPLCQLYAPIYRQVTLTDLLAHPGLDFGPAETVTAYDSIWSGFEDFLTHDLGGRPFAVIGDSQGAAMLELLLEHLVDKVPALRSRLVVAVILGGNVEVPPGRLLGGTFEHIPACDRTGETGCVIAYSAFPSTPPADALFGRPGQGVSLQSDQTAKRGRRVVCVDPAALSGGSALLDSVFPVPSGAPTPWVAFPGLYRARCEQQDGASWLEVTKATRRGDHRPTPVSEQGGPAYGYHVFDLPLAQGDLVDDVAAAEEAWTAAHR